MIFGVPAEIPLGHLPNASQKRYRYADPLCMISVKSWLIDFRSFRNYTTSEKLKYS
jgi:hypothetical protein